MRVASVVSSGGAGMPLTGFSAQNHPQQVLVHGAKVDVDERATPPELFAALDRRFRFTVDACALPRNAKRERYWTPEQDGLKQDWSGERVWCNPPFSSIEPWVAKASEWRFEEAELIVMLLPANRTELGWWQKYIEPYRDRGYCCGYCGAEEWPIPPITVEFLPGRLRFGLGGAAPLPNTRPPFGCCLVIWESKVAPSEAARKAARERGET